MVQFATACWASPMRVSAAATWLLESAILAFRLSACMVAVSSACWV